MHYEEHGQMASRGAFQAIARFATALFCLAAFSGCTVQIGSPSTRTTGPGITAHVQIVHGQAGSTLVLLPVMIQGHGPFTFALDTGASTSLIDRALAQQLGLKQTGAPQPIVGIGSNELAVPVRIANWHIEGIKLPRVTVLSGNLQSAGQTQQLQGLIGSDIWDQFGTITIDYAQSTLTVYKQIARATDWPSLRTPD